MKLKTFAFALAALMMQSMPLLATYVGFGIFTVDGNNSSTNPVRVSNIPYPATLRITYISGYFYNCGPRRF